MGRVARARVVTQESCFHQTATTRPKSHRLEMPRRPAVSPAGRLAAGKWRRASGLDHIRGLEPPLSLEELELDLLTFPEGPEPIA